MSSRSTQDCDAAEVWPADMGGGSGAHACEPRVPRPPPPLSGATFSARDQRRDLGDEEQGRHPHPATEETLLPSRFLPALRHHGHALCDALGAPPLLTPRSQSAFYPPSAGGPAPSECSRPAVARGLACRAPPQPIQTRIGLRGPPPGYSRGQDPLGQLDRAWGVWAELCCGGTGMEAAAELSCGAQTRVSSPPGGPEEKSPLERCALCGEGEESRWRPPPGSPPVTAGRGVGAPSGEVFGLKPE